MQKLLIIDGNSIINRAFYAIRLLTTKGGQPTNGIYGFLNILFKYTEELQPDYISVAFDLKGPTFRHAEFEAYKAQRKGMPDELASQLPILKEILGAMNISILEKEGYEADDIIGTISEMCEREGLECLIVTGDKDDLQLASQSTKILLTTTRAGQTQTEVFTDKEVFEKYGVTPTEFIDVKALMGDHSDNIPGIAGIGEKTALELISRFKSIEKLYENIDSPDIKKGVRDKLIAGREMAYLSKRLSTIDRAVPLDIKLSDMAKKEYDTEKLEELFRRLEFGSFLKRLNLKPKQAEFSAPKAKVVESTDELRKILNEINEFYFLLFISIGIAFSDGERSYYAPFSSVSVSDFKDVFENKNIKKISHDVKEAEVFLHGFGIHLQGIAFDTQIAAYILDPAQPGYSLPQIAAKYLGIRLELSGSGKENGAEGGNRLQGDERFEYISNLIGVLGPLRKTMDEKISSLGQTELYYDIELPLTMVLADMQITGFKVDREQLIEFSKVLGERIAELEKSIYACAGSEFNINSPKQLGKVLFEDLGLKASKKTKTGYSTDAEVLERLRGSHFIIDLILEYRQLVKLKSTYADGLVSVINPETGRIHSSFNQTVTVTGRISSTEPNLQNIPVRLELGREIRKMFIASDDEHVLVGADYSQIELRVLAHVSGDEAMIEAFRSNADIHTLTASQVFHIPPDMVTPLMRTRAKAVNFGIVYGISDFSLARDLGITRKEAKQYIEHYFNTYPKVKEYLDRIVKEAKEKGYVTTLHGRRRYIPELSSSNRNIRSFGERVAMNTPIQGSAADIIKIAMVRVHNKLKINAPKSRLILQVHDELIVDAHVDEVEAVKEILKSEMENAAALLVPLVASVNVGKSWYDTK